MQIFFTWYRIKVYGKAGRRIKTKCGAKQLRAGGGSENIQEGTFFLYELTVVFVEEKAEYHPVLQEEEQKFS